MSVFMELNHLTLDIPIFNTDRSFRSSLMSRFFVGGNISCNKKTKKFFVRALDDINLRFEEGDRVGLIGHNGAGKTTLLRVLANIYKPDYGMYRYHGRITPLFNISIGMEYDDTGLDNIYNIGMFLGMGQSEIEARVDDIVSFSDLGKFINLPVRTYSTGMQTRLSFAIATALQPDILLMDEGIGAGDANFVQKAEARLQKFYANATILVIASHSDALITQLCNKAVLLNHGSLIAFGEVSEILDLYHNICVD